MLVSAVAEGSKNYMDEISMVASKIRRFYRHDSFGGRKGFALALKFQKRPPGLAL